MEVVKDQQNVNTYDPNKKYTWTPGTKFEFSGSEFGVLLNALRAILSSEEAQRILLAERASEMIENVLAKSVAKGDVKEVVEENS
jgi:hypothetical protein